MACFSEYQLKLRKNYVKIKLKYVLEENERRFGKRERRMHYTYMLRCKDGTYYTGYTNDLEKRVKAHNEGKGARYTKGRGPVELVYYEEYEEKSPAMRREWELKQLTRNEKETLMLQYQEKKELTEN